MKRPLSEFRPACYYGCLLTRPAQTLRFDDCEHPSSMESLLERLGAAPVQWNYKTECCGAGMTMANEDTVLKLSHKILADAAAHGANCLVVACPMCHVNLDMKQADIERRFGTSHAMMVYYLSDLVGLALGLDEKRLGIDRHFVRK
jgi:heterodisulfide reductase subunit B